MVESVEIVCVDIDFNDVTSFVGIVSVVSVNASPVILSVVDTVAGNSVVDDESIDVLVEGLFCVSVWVFDACTVVVVVVSAVVDSISAEVVFRTSVELVSDNAEVVTSLLVCSVCSTVVDVSELGKVEASVVIVDVPDDPTMCVTGVAVDADFVGSSVAVVDVDAVLSVDITVVPGVGYSIVLISE